MSVPSPNSVEPPAFSVAHPLDEFYARSGLAVPPLQQIDGEEVPEPYRRLLVHQQDMTSTLENYHQQAVRLRVLGREQQGDQYYREVVLELEGSGKPVEFGAIKIHLALFPPGAREEILKERWPLGHILKEFAIVYSSRPKAFLRIASDRLISKVLHLSGVHLLYGRRNTLLDSEDRPLAEIVEILPPERKP